MAAGSVPHSRRARPTRYRASAKLKRRTLAARLSALSERYIHELEESPSIDPNKLGEALELLKMAKLAARPRKRRGESLRPIAQLRVGGVDLHRAPRAAVEDFLANRETPRDMSGSRRRARESKRNRDHARMLEQDR